jgi:hypothetical protein
MLSMLDREEKAPKRRYHGLSPLLDFVQMIFICYANGQALLVCKPAGDMTQQCRLSRKGTETDEPRPLGLHSRAELETPSQLAAK